MPSGIHGRRLRNVKATPQHNAVLPTEIPIPSDKRNVIPPSGAIGYCDWYVCTTQPQAEMRAVESLRREGISAYAPCEYFWRQPMRQNLKMPRREIQRPLFRSYLFVGVPGVLDDHTLSVLRERDLEGRNRHGLVAILGSLYGRPMPLDGEGKAFLRREARIERGEEAREGGEEAREGGDDGSLKVGDRLKIKTGPFATFGGTVAAVDPVEQRLLVQVSMLSKLVPIPLEYADVERAA